MAVQHTGVDMSPHDMKAFYQRVAMTESINGVTSYSMRIRKLTQCAMVSLADLVGQRGIR